MATRSEARGRSRMRDWGSAQSGLQAALAFYERQDEQRHVSRLSPAVLPGNVPDVCVPHADRKDSTSHPSVAINWRLEEIARMKKALVLLGVALLVFAVFVFPRIPTVTVKGKSLETKREPRVMSVPAAVPSPCGPGLAAQDLAGHCRARPKPTPGALEAIGATRGATRQSDAQTPMQRNSAPNK